MKQLLFFTLALLPYLAFAQDTVIIYKTYDDDTLWNVKNQMFIAIGDKQYDLFNITDNVYSTLNKNITLIKQ